MLLAQVPVHTLAQVAFSVTDLGGLGGVKSEAYGINDNGDVVGQASATSGKSHAFLYSQGVMQDLGTLGGTSSMASAINNAGQIVGWWTDTNNNDHAFLYSNGTNLDLGTLGGSTSRAYGINNHGQVVGYASNGGNIHAFVWSQGTMTDLGGGTNSVAYAINDNGLVAGYTRRTNDFPHPALYSQGTWSDLGVMDGLAGGLWAINNTGQGVGEIDLPGPDGFQGFLYSQGTMSYLDKLGVFSSRASGINDYGQAVGSLFFSNGWIHPFFYGAGKTTDLNTLLTTNSGWNLAAANAINNRAQIVGYGLNPSGQVDAFLLTPTALPPGLTIGLYAASSNSACPALTVTGPVGQSLGIECTTNPGAPGTWTVLTNITLTQPVQVWPDTNVNLGDGTQPSRFYRVVTLP